MNNLKKVGMATYKAYMAVGIIVMGVIAFSVIFTVIMRYFFGISYNFLEELITVMFAFTTFWGAGMCILEDEHIIIDFFIQRLSPKIRKMMNIFNYIMVTVVNVMMVYYSIKWISVAGKVLSKGMRVKFGYIYCFMPIGFTIGIVCGIIKLILIILDKENEVRFKPEGEEGSTQAGA